MKGAAGAFKLARTAPCTQTPRNECRTVRPARGRREEERGKRGEEGERGHRSLPWALCLSLLGMNCFLLYPGGSPPGFVRPTRGRSPLVEVCI